MPADAAGPDVSTSNSSAPVRRPERVLDGLGRIRPREEEAEIARPLGERDQLLADVAR